VALMSFCMNSRRAPWSCLAAGAPGQHVERVSQRTLYPHPLFLRRLKHHRVGNSRIGHPESGEHCTQQLAVTDFVSLADCRPFPTGEKMADLYSPRRLVLLSSVDLAGP